MRDVETVGSEHSQYWNKSMYKRRAVFAKSGGHCWYCGVDLRVRPVDKGTSPVMDIDHVVPRAEGGSNRMFNLVPSCPHCNSLKGKRSVDALRRRLWQEQYGLAFLSLAQFDKLVEWMEMMELYVDWPPMGRLFFENLFGSDDGSDDVGEDGWE